MDLEKMFRDLFGFSFDVDDFKCMSAVGKKHAEHLKIDQIHPSSETFLTYFKSGGPFKTYLDSVSLTAKNAQKLIDSQIHFNMDMAKEVIKYDIKDIDTALKDLTSGAIKL